MTASDRGNKQSELVPSELSSVVTLRWGELENVPKVATGLSAVIRVPTLQPAG